jgi:hypothetical protein
MLMSSRLPFAATLLACIATPLTAQELLGRNDRVFTLSRMLPANGAVQLHGLTGDLTVTEGESGRISYRAEKILRRGDVEDFAFRVIADGSGITICAVADEDDQCSASGLRAANRRGNWWRDRASLKITVEVPRGTRLTAGSGNGDVQVAVAARELSASSGNGDVRVTRADGPVRASSGNGDVFVETSNGPVSASSGNGDVHVSMDRVDDEGDMELSSGNGDIIVTVPDRFRATLEASTGNGSIRTDLPITIQGSISKQRMRGAINGGGRRLRMSSGNGEIELRRR